MIKHSIVTWDSSFRNFFHLLPSLSEQDYDLDNIEVIFVEQRSESTAQAVADAFGVSSVFQLCDTLRNRLNVRILCMNEPESEPYHPGRLLNAGLLEAQGEIVSTMDADILVTRDFLRVLDQVHAADPMVVANLYRYTADRPCGVSRKNWTRQIIDYELIRNTCPNGMSPIPDFVQNKAPLLSARREHWQAIHYYDSHRVFSTAYTLFGRDIAMRFRLLLGETEQVLPVASVHPWHPTELSRGQDIYQILFSVQDALIKWSEDNRCFDVEKRKAVSDVLYKKYQDAIETAIETSEQNMRASTRGR